RNADTSQNNIDAIACFMMAEQLIQQKDLFEKQCERNPNLYTLLNQLPIYHGIALYANGNYELALQQFNKASHLLNIQEEKDQKENDQEDQEQPNELQLKHQVQKINNNDKQLHALGQSSDMYKYLHAQLHYYKALTLIHCKGKTIVSKPYYK